MHHYLLHRCLQYAQAPSTPPRQSSNRLTRLTRDDRLQILTLRDAGLSYQHIVDQLGVTHNRVQYTCQSRKPTPRKARGQPFKKLSDDKADEIIAWYTASEGNHSRPYRRAIQESEEVLVCALRRRGIIVVRLLEKQKPTVLSQAQQDQAPSSGFQGE